MSIEAKRSLIALVRRVVFTGLILLGAWLVLLWLRGHIPESIIRMLNEEVANQPGNTPLSGIPALSYDSSTWDWSSSLFRTREIGSSVRIPVAELMRGRLQGTLKFIGQAALISLIVSSLLLLIGMFISRITERPGWLARVRSILRLVIVSAGASIPTFFIGTWVIVFLATNQPSPQPTAAMLFWSVILASMLPAWLLVQAGLGELTNMPEDLSVSKMIPRLGISLIIRSLRLIGIIIVISITGEQLMAQPGLGWPLVSALNQRDFPLAFAITWIFVVIVAVTRLAADLIKIASGRFMQSASTEPVKEHPAYSRRIPKGWLVFSLALVAISIVVAIVGPLLAPYGFNEVSIQDRLTGPSARHLFGTDNVGRDILSRLLYGIRTDIFTGLVCAGIVCLIAAGWALLAGHFRKLNSWVGDLLEDLVTLPGQIISVFPWLVLLLLSVSMVDMNGRSPSRLYLGWPVISLIISLMLLPRAVSLVQEAYRSPPHGKGLFQGILLAVPVMFIFTVAGGMLYLSTASYLGLGVPPPYVELSNMITGAGRQFMMVAPWIALWPPVFLILLLLIWVMAGEALLERLGFRSKAVWSKIME